MSVEVAEVAATAVANMFAQVASRGSDVPLEDRLRASGWVEKQPGASGLRREWQKGDIVAAQFGRGSTAFLETTVEIARPDPEDPDSEDQLTVEFERRFGRNLAQLVAHLGEATFVGSYGDEGFPDDADAVMIALWRIGSGVVALNFKHEDSGVPFRITATVQ